MNSVYKKLDNVRKPRVQISYELEDGGKSVAKEIPFVVGVMGDYSGHSAEASIPLKDRKFIAIDGDNFNQVMQKMNPSLSLKVENTLVDDDQQMAVDLTFNRMEDFEPDQIARQVPALKKLLDVRSQLRDLLSKADRSEALENILESLMQDQQQMKLLSQQVSDESSTDDEAPKSEEKDND